VDALDATRATKVIEAVGTKETTDTMAAASEVQAGAELRASRGHDQQFLRPALYGLLSAAGLLAFYLGVITLAQDWQHALQQLGEDRWFVGAIAAGFGLQIALFTFLRALHASARAGGVVASTGTSTGAMLACCAHHLFDVLPVLGLSGAAAFLDAYKTPLLWLAIVMNAAGVAYLLLQIRKHHVSQDVAAAPGAACHIAAP
jgi:hypothetical protein